MKYRNKDSWSKVTDWLYLKINSFFWYGLQISSILIILLITFSTL